MGVVKQAIHGTELHSTSSFQSGAMAERGELDNSAERVFSTGVLRCDGEPAVELLRRIRPTADLACVPPSESWRPPAPRYDSEMDAMGLGSGG